jgi:hypothetical protein
LPVRLVYTSLSPAKSLVFDLGVFEASAMPAGSTVQLAPFCAGFDGGGPRRVRAILVKIYPA